MNKYITIDTETGGIGPEADLLTAYFGVLDENLNLVSELTIKLRPDSKDDFYSVSAEALRINKIDLIKHFEEADSKSTAGSKLLHFLQESTSYVGGKVQRLVPIGHNVVFDIEKISSKLLSKKTLDQYIGYRKLDTGTLGQFYQLIGLIPPSVSASLSSLMNFYGLQFEGEAHNERVDALACVAVLKKMIEQVKK